MREWLLGDQDNAGSSDSRRISITSNETSSFRPIKPMQRTYSESRVDEHTLKTPTNAEKPLVSSTSVPEKLSSAVPTTSTKSLSVDKLKKLTEVKPSSLPSAICNEIPMSRKKDSGSSSSSVSGNSNVGRLEQDSFEKISPKPAGGPCVDDRSSS